MIRVLPLSVVVAAAACIAWSAAALAGERLVIGFVDIAGDPRHRSLTDSGGLVVEERGRPLDGAKLAVRDSAAIGRALGIDIQIVEESAPDAQSVATAVAKLHAESGARMILLDTPAPALTAAARSVDEKEVLLFNVSAEDDDLRGKDCKPNLMHLFPSLAMRTDALAQFVVERKWRDVLVLEGESPSDAAFVSAFQRSAKRFGARVVERRKLAFNRDPRQRDQNNFALLTGGVSYDAVLVADETEEIGRYVPYQTQLARPVIGSAGLMSLPWHFAWTRNGGPQLSLRFRRLAQRDMRGADWAAWVGVRAIVEAVTRTQSTDFAQLVSYLKSDALRIDGFKGPALSFRPWDNQLRQPVLLATTNAVIDEAPLRPFSHATQTLDTLGYDRPESACRMGS